MNAAVVVYVAAFYYGVLQKGRAGRLFRQPWLTMPGTMCYSIYLYHYVIAEQWMHFTTRMFGTEHVLLTDVTVQMVLALPVILLGASAMYLAVGRPFVVSSHIETRRWRPVAHPAAPEVSI
jgi:peptidoglycan/LPS O-acetylase OafA/YrhL